MSEPSPNSPLQKRINGSGLEPSPSVLRKAEPGDYEDLVRMFLQYYSENTPECFPMSPKKVQWWIERALFPENIAPDDTGPRGLIAVIGPLGKLEAIVFVTISEWWYSEQPCISLLAFYVDPEFRKSKHAVACVDYLKRQCDLLGLPLYADIVASHRTEAKCRFFGRHLPKIGEFFLRAPQKPGNG